jgi:hypothetical protein
LSGHSNKFSSAGNSFKNLQFHSRLILLSSKQKQVDLMMFLFNGNSMAGWHTFNGKLIDVECAKWRIILNAKSNVNAHGDVSTEHGSRV